MDRITKRSTASPSSWVPCNQSVAKLYSRAYQPGRGLLECPLPSLSSWLSGHPLVAKLYFSDAPVSCRIPVIPELSPPCPSNCCAIEEVTTTASLVHWPYYTHRLDFCYGPRSPNLNSQLKSERSRTAAIGS